MDEGSNLVNSRFSMPLTKLGAKQYYLGIFFKVRAGFPMKKIAIIEFISEGILWLNRKKMYRDLSDLFIGSILQSYNFVTINLNYYNYFGILCKEMVSCKKNKAN